MAIKLEYAAALVELGRLDLHSLPDLAIEWLIDGVQSESLILLAGETFFAAAYANDLQGQFRTILGELGIVPPTRSQAAILLRDQIARDVVSGRVLPATGARELVDLQQETEEEFPDAHYPYVGSGFGIATIYGLYHSYDEVYEERGFQHIDTEVIEACRQLVACSDA